MKELHFYFQSVMILVALALALQGHHDGAFYAYAALIAFFLGVYQYGMSWFLMSKISRNKKLLKIYFFGVKVYFLAMAIMAFNSDHIDDHHWRFMFFYLLFFYSIFFLVVTEELLRRKIHLS